MEREGGKKDGEENKDGEADKAEEDEDDNMSVGLSSDEEGSEDDDLDL